jgi:hypothetical protein
MLVGALLLLPIAVLLTPVPVDPPVKPESFGWAALAGTTTVAGLLLVLLPSNAAALVLGVHLLMTRTQTGRSMQALSQNAALARIVGIDVAKVVRVTWPRSAAREVEACSRPQPVDPGSEPGGRRGLLFGAALFAIGQSTPPSGVLVIRPAAGRHRAAALPLILAAGWRPRPGRPFVDETGDRGASTSAFLGAFA